MLAGEYGPAPLTPHRHGPQSRLLHQSHQLTAALPSREVVTLRELIVTENVGLDGVFESPETWSGEFQSPDLQEIMYSGMNETDTMVFGRETFQEFAAFWPDSDMEPFASYMNNIDKYVVSHSMSKAEWGSGNPVPIIRDLATGIQQLKQKEGKNIGVIGSGALVRSLLDHNLVDELILAVHPVVLGNGKRLLGDQQRRNLELIDSRALRGGSIYMAYKPLPVN